MPITRVTREQVRRASRARNAALKKDRQLREAQKEREKLAREAARRREREKKEWTFELTPRRSLALFGRARIWIHGVSLYPKHDAITRYSFDHQHADDEVLFQWHRAGDESKDYSDFENRRLVPFVELFCDLPPARLGKKRVLDFRYDALERSRVLVFSDAEKLADLTLSPRRGKLRGEVDCFGRHLSLYFIHVNLPRSDIGGQWFFRGINGRLR